MNALKKVLSWLLALTMLLSMSTTVAFAGEIMAVFTLESPEAAVKVGDTFTIPVKITENKSIASLTMNTKFDQTAFRLDKIDFTNKEVFSGCLSGGQTDSSNDKYGKWLITQATASADTGLLVELTFTVLDTATAGDYTIDLEAEELYDAEYNDLDCTIVPATVTVAEDEPVGSPKIVVGYTENGETKYNEIDDNHLFLQAGGQTVGADYNWPTTELLYVLDANGNVIEDIDWDMDDHSQIFWSNESSYPLTASYAQVRGNTDGAKATITATLPDESTVSIEVETKAYANTILAYNVTSEDTNYYSSYDSAKGRTLIVDTGATFTLSPTKVCSGKSTQLTDEQLANNTLTYASGDESILTVDAQTGEYKVVGKGETTIYMCVAGQEHGKNTVAPLKAINVYCGDAYAQDLRFSKDGTLLEKDYPVTNTFGTTTYYAQTSVAVGETQEIALTSIPAAAIENITVGSVSSASTANVTVVNDNGTLKLTGVAETESPIKVSVQWKRTNVSTVTGTFATALYVNVTEGDVAVTGVTLDQENLNLVLGGTETATLTATVTPENATDKTVTWTSSNEEVATVNENGKVTAIAAGDAIITATANNGVNGSCAVTVKEAEIIYYATSVKTVITEASDNKEPYETSSNGNTNKYVYIVGSDNIGFTMQGKSTVYSKNNPDTGLATSQNVTWKSNYDTSIASVDENGLITWNGGYGKYIASASAPTANGGSYAGNIEIYFTPAIAKTAEIEVSDENGKVTDTADTTSFKGNEVTAYIVEDGSDIILDAVLNASEMADYVKWTVKADSKYNFVALSGANNAEGGKLTITPDTYGKKISADGDFKLLQVTATVPSYAGGAKSTNVTSETIYILLVEEAEEPIVTIDEDHADMNVSAETVAEGEQIQLQLSIENDKDASSKYNSYEFHVNYNSERLTYESVSCSDGENCAVTETEKGVLVINGYGADKTVSEDAFVTLTFKANEVSQNTDTTINLTQAYRDTSTGAIDTNIDEIKVETAEKTITIEDKKASYKVTFSETVKVNGEDVTEATVTEGESVTFNVIEKTGYTYTVDGATKNTDGSYTVEPTGNVTVTITHTAKTYSVTVEGSGKDDVTASASAAYGKSYAFTLNKDDGYNYTVSVKVGGQTVSTSENNGTYTIAANDVTSSIVITVVKEAKAPVKTEYTVTLYENGVSNAATEKATEGEAYAKSATEGYKIYKVVMNEQEISSFTAESVSIASVTGNIEIYMGKIYDVTLPEDQTVIGETEANYGSDYTFTVADGYQASATVGGQPAGLTENEDGSFTIAGTGITGEIVITTEKISYVETVTVYDYVKSENAALIQLVVATAKEGALSEDEILQYNGANMFWSEKYAGYAYLVAVAADEDKLTDETAAANIGKATATATAISYAGDVNMTGSTDINDAQLVYDIYKTLYSDFETVSMEKLLRADMNADHAVNVSDARAVAAIVNN